MLSPSATIRSRMNIAQIPESSLPQSPQMPLHTVNREHSYHSNGPRRGARDIDIDQTLNSCLRMRAIAYHDRDFSSHVSVLDGWNGIFSALSSRLMASKEFPYPIQLIIMMITCHRIPISSHVTIASPFISSSSSYSWSPSSPIGMRPGSSFLAFLAYCSAHALALTHSLMRASTDCPCLFRIAWLTRSATSLRRSGLSRAAMAGDRVSGLKTKSDMVCSRS